MLKADVLFKKLMRLTIKENEKKKPAEGFSTV
jgi:hypothetical protein